jgi:hypothetical protein
VLVAIIESLHRNLPLAFPEEGDGGAGSSSAVAVDDDDVEFVPSTSLEDQPLSHTGVMGLLIVNIVKSYPNDETPRW